jgi:hypothetical protein
VFDQVSFNRIHYNGSRLTMPSVWPRRSSKIFNRSKPWGSSRMKSSDLIPLKISKCRDNRTVLITLKVAITFLKKISFHLTVTPDHQERKQNRMTQCSIYIKNDSIYDDIYLIYNFVRI